MLSTDGWCDAGNETGGYILRSRRLPRGFYMPNVTRAFIPVLLLLGACSHRGSRSQAAKPTPLPGTVLTADDIQRSPGQSLEQLLLARVPGLTLTRAADGHSKLVLRGKNTILGDDEVLFVVNGIPLGPAVSGNLAAINV